jgi:hypothetical protein
MGLADPGASHPPALSEGSRDQERDHLREARAPLYGQGLLIQLTSPFMLASQALDRGQDSQTVGHEAVSEDDVAEDEQLQRSPNTPMAALIGHSDRGSHASPILLAIEPPPGTTVPASGCKPQAEGATC